MPHDQALCLPDDIVAKADRSSMLASLEVRTSFLQPLLREQLATGRLDADGYIDRNAVRALSMTSSGETITGRTCCRL